MILTNEYCTDINKKNIEWIIVVNIVTLDFKTVSGCRPDKYNTENF